MWQAMETEDEQLLDIPPLEFFDLLVRIAHTAFAVKLSASVPAEQSQQ